MGGIHSTTIEKHVYDDLFSKYNKVKSNYETQQMYLDTLNKTICDLENTIVNNKIKIYNIEQEIENNIKLCESIKSNYISKIINKDNLICELDICIEYNNSLLIKKDKTLEYLRNKLIKLNNKNKNILYLENKLKIIENNSKNHRVVVCDLSKKYNQKITKLEETNTKLEKHVLYLEKVNNEVNNN